ncbi:hypothetical protein FS749_016292 [Ceratobasidium sp. UAMH 11750]|nr:hypothetical protein FS749_016292 [Ceratobasidium sp. UAMH 11750]
MEEKLWATKFYRINELLQMVCTHLGDAEIRALASTDRENSIRLAPNVWYHLRGLGNLLAVLDDSLRVTATKAGKPAVTIPMPARLEASRIQRFLQLATHVVLLDVHCNPGRWIHWRGLERLLPLLDQAQDGRTALLPCVKEAFISADRWPAERPFAPLVRLFADRSLCKLQVVPPGSISYPRSSPADTVEVFNILAAASHPSAPLLTSVGIFPEDEPAAVHSRSIVLDAFTPILNRLKSLHISEWFLSDVTVRALAAASLERLSIHGRFAAESDSLQWLPHLLFDEPGFACLRSLHITNVPFAKIVHVLSTPGLLLQVVHLRIAISPVVDLEENNDEALYLQTLQRIAAAPKIKNIVLAAREQEWESAYSLRAQVLAPLAQMNLDTLRLYQICIPNSDGFRMFHDGGWTNLRYLSLMHQDLTPSDLVAFSSFPRLSRLSANVSTSLGQPRHEPLGTQFAGPLELTTRAMLRGPAQTKEERSRVLTRIACLFLDLCREGLTVTVERTYRPRSEVDTADYAWAKVLDRHLTKVGFPPIRFRS